MDPGLTPFCCWQRQNTSESDWGCHSGFFTPRVTPLNIHSHSRQTFVLFIQVHFIRAGQWKRLDGAPFQIGSSRSVNRDKPVVRDVGANSRPVYSCLDQCCNLVAAICATLHIVFLPHEDASFFRTITYIFIILGHGWLKYAVILLRTSACCLSTGQRGKVYIRNQFGTMRG